MTQIVVFVVLVTAAVGIAVVVERRRDPAPTRTAYPVPQQLARRDFVRPEAPWLVVLFSSATCDSCRQASTVVDAAAGPDVAVQEVEVGAEPELHERYRIEAVPTVVIADAAGVVVGHFLGAPTDADLRSKLAEARSPG